MLKRLILLLSLVLLPWPALADELRVVATTQSMGMLANAVGGEHVRLQVLAPPDRDAHFLQARPSMLHHLRRADLLVAVGADLEIGWLPVAVKRSANPALLPGKPGFFEAADHVDLLEVGQSGSGHVHAHGNPHFSLDPLRMAELLLALGHHLGELDPDHAADYRRNAQQAAQRLRERLPAWQARVRGAPGAVFHHKDTLYLMQRLQLPTLGYLEPVPGVPPTAGHLRRLTEELQGRKGIIIHAPYYPARGPDKLARALGWPTAQLFTEPHESRLDSYIALIDQWVETLASAR